MQSLSKLIAFVRHRVGNRLRRYRYPQFVFGQAIARRIGRAPKPRTLRIVDIPCGDGEIAFLLSRRTRSQVYGLDLALDRVDRARAVFGSGDVTFLCGDLFEYLGSSQNIDVLCVVNSLFCFPDAKRVLRFAHDALRSDGAVFVVIPNVRSANYRMFVRDNPTVNKCEFTDEEAIEIFREAGFETTYSSGIARSRWYGRRGLNRLRMFRDPYLVAADWTLKLARRGEPAYFLFELHKSDPTSTKLEVVEAAFPVRSPSASQLSQEH